MEFYSDEHKAKIARLEKLWENLHELADMCKEYGIQDMLQDNGALTGWPLKWIQHHQMQIHFREALPWSITKRSSGSKAWGLPTGKLRMPPAVVATRSPVH